MFPIEPLAKLPSAASQTDKTILGPKLEELIAAVNDLHGRIAPPAPVPEPAPIPDPSPVVRVGITALQQAALDGIAAGQVVELEGPGMLLTVLVRSVRVVAPAPPPAPGVPLIVVDTSSISGGQIEEGETTPVTGSVNVTDGDASSPVTGLGVSSVTYTQGASGWLTPTWDGANDQADWEIDPTGLTAGLYSAFFDITASNAASVRITASLEIIEVPPTEPGAFIAPQFSLPAFPSPGSGVTHDSNTDDTSGEPFTPEAIGYYA